MKEQTKAWVRPKNWTKNWDKWYQNHDRALAGPSRPARPSEIAGGWCAIYNTLEKMNEPEAVKLFQELYFGVASVSETRKRFKADPRLKQFNLTLCFTITEIWKAIGTGDADFFRHFADALERKGAPSSKARAWLNWKHRPDRDTGEIPAFTARELIDAADKAGVEISAERQLTRWMTELGYLFKNSRGNRTNKKKLSGHS